MMTPPDPDHLERYRVLRETFRELKQTLVKEYLPKKALPQSAKKIGIPVQEGTMVFDCEEDMSVLLDYCIHDHREVPFKGKPQNAVEKWLAHEPPPAGTREREMLEACAAARYTVLLVEKSVLGQGAYVRDAFTEERLFLTDVGLGSSAHPGMAVACRILVASGITMTTGATMQVHPETAYSIVDALESALGEMPDPRKLSPAERARFSAVIIRACLETGAED